MAERDARIDRLLLGQEIADFLYREAELLDEQPAPVLSEGAQPHGTRAVAAARFWSRINDA
jgi:hypothetical protein